MGSALPWALVALCFALGVASRSVSDTFVVFVPALQHDFDANRGPVTLIYSFALLVGGTAAPITGWILDRFGLRALTRLDADFAVRREAAGIAVTGRVQAHAEQICVVTGESVAAMIDESVALRFVAEDAAMAPEEIELGGDALDTLPYAGGAIDLGEAAAETMALALDPYPRAPGAEAVLRAAGVVSEEEAGPFGALAALRGRLGE